MKKVYCILMVFILCGCATIMLGEYQTITVTTDPPGATVRVQGQEKTSPAKFQLKRGLTGAQIMVEKEGYMPLRKSLKSEISGLAYTDTLLAVNPQSYAKPRYYVYKPSRVHLKLLSTEKAGWKKVAVAINELTVQPTVISPGSDFGFHARFNVEDNTNLDANTVVVIEYSIMQNKTVLFSDTVPMKTQKKKQYDMTKRGTC